MDKQLYYTLDDGADYNITMTLKDCMDWIKNDTEGRTEIETAEMQYTITPIWMTQEEFESLPEVE
jgi:hypothetical protein